MVDSSGLRVFHRYNIHLLKFTSNVLSHNCQKGEDMLSKVRVLGYLQEVALNILLQGLNNIGMP